MGVRELLRILQAANKIPLCCGLAHRSTWPRKRRLHAASPSNTLPTRSFCANGHANRC